MITPETTTIEIDYQEIHALSVGLLGLMQEDDTSIGVGSMATIMTLGRMLSPKRLSPDQEIDFIKATLDWCGAFFAEGTA